jgi:Lar family restriction alleviation protein
MSAHIERCPFCGSEADMQNDFGDIYWVQCKSLECGAVEGSIHSSPAPALARWNRRAPQSPAGSEQEPQ